MVHAALIGMEFDRGLPAHERPMFTEGYEGFFHLVHIEGNMEEANMAYIIRDHDREKFEAKKTLVQNLANTLNEKYGTGTIQLELEDEYKNMKELILPVMYIVETARQAMIDVGVEPLVTPVRGGTDGAQLTYQGLPTPNLFNGGHNYHGKYEYIPVESMEKAVDVIVRIAALYAEK